MTAVIIILSVTDLIFIIFIIAKRRQIRKICRQMEFIINNKSNAKITFDTPFKDINRLTVLLNEIIDKAHRTERLSEQREGELKSTVTNLSHDIRTPLTSLDGYFQLLSQAETNEAREKYTKIIRMRIASLKDILEELFTYTKLQNSDYELQLENLYINQTIYEAAFAFYEDFKARGIEPIMDITEESIAVNGNGEALLRVFHNIIKNALEHGELDGNPAETVVLSLQRLNGEAVFSCSNRVSNSADINISQVFDKFYKADNARTQVSTGLGLSIARELTQRMNGITEAELEDNVFTITVRIKEAG